MKRHLLLITLALLLAVSANAQTIGVYWDEAGTVTEIPGLAPTFTGYVVIFAEDVVSGAAYGLQIRDLDLGDGGAPEILFASATYPAGLQIGNEFAGGIEIGLTNVQYGFLGDPVVISTLEFVNISGGVAHAAVDVLPHTTYGDALYADGGAALHALSPLADAIANEDMSFTNVKNLFR